MIRRLPGLCTLAALTFAAGAAAAVTVRLEAEAAETRHDLGGVGLEPVACRGASEGAALQGMDLRGEWIEFAVELPRASAVLDSLRSAGNFEVRRTFVLEYWRIGSDRPAAVDTLVTAPGSGLG